MSKIEWDKTLANPNRYSIMSALDSADRIGYSVFASSLGITKSLLSKHITLLDRAGFIVVHKIPRGRVFLTELSATDLGKQRFRQFKMQLLTVGDIIIKSQE